MKKHCFLGTAAGWTKEERLAQRKTHGTHDDLLNLYEYLHDRYDGEQIVVTKNGRSAIAAALKYGLEQKRYKEEGPPAFSLQAVLDYDAGKWSPENKKTPTEVIVNGFTCRAVVQGVEGAGCKPVYADIDPETLNFTLESLEKVVTKHTQAIIVQNTLGQMVDIQMVQKFAKKHHLLVIEDLAHAAGRYYADGREAGRAGDVTVLSFGKEKAVDVVNGGAAIFHKIEWLIPVPQEQPSSQEEFRARIYPTLGAIYRKLSYVHLQGVAMRIWLKLGWVEKSAEGEIDFEKVTLGDFQAKLVVPKLKHLTDDPIREFYLVNNRAEVLAKLRKAGYYFDGFWYERPVAPERYYQDAHFPEKDCPNAMFVAEHIINFPTYYSEIELRRAREIIKPYLMDSAEVKSKIAADKRKSSGKDQKSSKKGRKSSEKTQRSGEKGQKAVKGGNK